MSLDFKQHLRDRIELHRQATGKNPVALYLTQPEFRLISDQLNREHSFISDKVSFKVEPSLVRYSFDGVPIKIIESFYVEHRVDKRICEHEPDVIEKYVKPRLEAQFAEHVARLGHHRIEHREDKKAFLLRAELQGEIIVDPETLLEKPSHVN